MDKIIVILQFNYVQCTGQFKVHAIIFSVQYEFFYKLEQEFHLLTGPYHQIIKRPKPLRPPQINRAYGPTCAFSSSDSSET